jgi:hypothetical protein
MYLSFSPVFSIIKCSFVLGICSAGGGKSFTISTISPHPDPEHCLPQRKLTVPSKFETLQLS